MHNTTDTQAPAPRRAPLFARFRASFSNSPRNLPVAAPGEGSLWDLEADEAQQILGTLAEIHIEVPAHAPLTEDQDQVRPVRAIDTEELEFLWALDPTMMLHLLENASPGGRNAVFQRDLRRLALRLIIDTPAGPPRRASEFLARADMYVLQELWGGQDAPSCGPWTGPAGVDVEIAAVDQGILPQVIAEFSNLFHDWAQDPVRAWTALEAATVMCEHERFRSEPVEPEPDPVIFAIRDRGPGVDLAWIWKLTAPELRKLLEEGLGDRYSDLPGFHRDLRELALHLILDAPVGPPRDEASFFGRCIRYLLEHSWGGRIYESYETHTPWTGVPGKDVQIAAVTAGAPAATELLAAEVANLLRVWVADPMDARSAAISAGIDLNNAALFA